MKNSSVNKSSPTLTTNNTINNSDGTHQTLSYLAELKNSLPLGRDSIDMTS